MSKNNMIINGIDVSECVFFKERYTRIGDDVDNDISFKNHCMLSEYPFSIGDCDKINCHFKQLKRLQEENEELKRKKDEYYLRTLDYETKISYLIQALEEIKDRIIHPDGLPENYTLKRYILEECNEVLNDRN